MVLLISLSLASNAVVASTTPAAAAAAAAADRELEMVVSYSELKDAFAADRLDAKS